VTHWIHLPAYAFIARAAYRWAREQHFERKMRKKLSLHTCQPLFAGLDPRCPGCKQAKADWLAAMERE
jgi:hypothetical protein